MHRSVLVLAACVGLGSAGLAQTAAKPPRKLSVAVADFTVNGGDRAAAVGLGKNLADAFSAPLSKSGRFQLFDRRQTQALLKEVGLSQAGLTESARKLKSANVDVLVAGSINVNSRDNLRVDVQFVRVETAEIETAGSAEGRDARDFGSIAQKIVNELSVKYPLQGTILAAVPGQPGRYYIDVGRESSVKNGDSGKVSRTVTYGDRTGSEKVADFKVVNVEDSSFPQIEVKLTLKNYAIKPGDPVVFSANGATPPPFQQGRLEVRVSVQSARVLVNGTERGVASSTAPLQLQLDARQYTVTVNAPGHKPATGTVELKPGETFAFAPPLEPLPGSLELRGPPGATVLVDGQARGATDASGRLEIAGLPPGARQVVVRAAGYKERGLAVELRPGERQVLTVALEREPPPVARAELRLSPVVPGARAYLDGKELEPFKDGRLSIATTPGDHTVEVRAEGYAGHTQTLRLEANASQTLQATLRLITGGLTVLSNPPGAAVRVNGKDAGRTPSTLQDLRPGPHQVELRLDGFQTASLTVTVPPGATASTGPVALRRAPGATVSLAGLSPPDARLLVDGRPTPTEGGALGLPPGTYTLRLEREGYTAVEQRVTLGSGQRLEFGRKLEARPAVLSLSLSPPDARLRVDGQPASGPELTLRPGPHTVEVEREGYEPLRLSLQLEPGARVSRAVELAPKAAVVDLAGLSPADARLLVDGQPVAVQGGAATLRPGSYRLRLEREGHQPYEGTVTLTPGQRLEFGRTLPPKDAVLTLEGVPEGAKVTLDGKERTERTLTLPPATYRLRVEAEGFAPFERTLTLGAGASETARVELRTATGGLTVTSDPPGARVILDGRDVGATPLTLGGLQPGRHSLELKLEGYESRETPFAVAAGATLELAPPLRPTTAALRLNVSPAGAVVTLDGRRLSPEELGRDLRLPEGRHEVEASLEGHVSQKMSIELRGGEREMKELALAKVAPAREPGTGVFLAASGGSDEALGSRERPFATLAKALREARPSEPITLLDGTYSLPTGPLSLPSGAVLRAANRGGAVLSGPGGSPAGGLVLEGPAVLEGLVLKNFATALTARGGPVELREVTLQGNARAIVASQSAVVRLTNSTIAGNGAGTQFAAVRVEGTARLEVAGGSFADNAYGAITAGLNAAVVISGASFRNNSAVEGGGHVNLTGSVNATITNSSFVGSTNSIRATAGVTGSACGNTFTNTRQPLVEPASPFKVGGC